MAMTRAYTLADRFELPEAGDQLFEALEGKLVVNSAPDNNHAETVVVLNVLLWRARRAGYGRGYSAPRAVAFDFPTRGMHAEKVMHPDMGCPTTGTSTSSPALSNSLSIVKGACANRRGYVRATS